jgi:hypothetical protein
LIVGLAGLIYYIWYNGYYPLIVAKLDWWFTVFLVTGIEVLKEDKGIGLAIFCFLFQALTWLVTYIFIKITFIDTFFPRFRIITPMKDSYWIARKVKFTKGPDLKYKYCYVKFHLFPLVQWHKIKIPKPEFFHRKPVENGFKGIRWRRFPASIDVFCTTANVVFDKIENCYVMGVAQDLYRHDDVGEYEKQAFEGIQKIGTQVIESVKGDWSLIKDQFHMGIVVREKELPKVEILKKMETPIIIPEKQDTSDIQPPQKKKVIIKIIRHRSGEDDVRAEPDTN